jgi:hypothetical protein
MALFILLSRTKPMERSRYLTHAALRITFTLPLFIFLYLSAFSLIVYSQNPQTESVPQPTPEIQVEEDPTKPILFSVRNEYRNLKNGAWANTVLLRVDKLSFRNFKNKGGVKGLILRVDIPFNTVHRQGETKFGLGDLYGQVLYLPLVRRKFAFAVGSGIILPTTTSDSLGQGKLIVAPAAVPVWYFARRKRLVLVRFQNFFSVAGKSSRPGINYFVADPIIVQPLNRKWWITINTEFKWDWRTKRPSAISGFQIGRVVLARFGFWLKPEIPWGQGRPGDFTLKLTLFRLR